MSDQLPLDCIPARYPELRGKVAVVTGGAKGIGEAVSRRLAVEGMSIAALDVAPDALEDLVDSLAPVGVPVVPIETDMGSTVAIDEAFDRIEKEWGGVDLLVNNAADLRRVRLEAQTPALLERQLAINVIGPHHAAMRASATMRERGGGSIVSLSSVGGARAHRRGFPYDATKGAIDAMTRALAVDLGEYGIRANAVAPGLTHTYRWAPNMDSEAYERAGKSVPLQRFGTTADMASAVAFLASDDASYITGQVLYVDGGMVAQLTPPASDPDSQ